MSQYRVSCNTHSKWSRTTQTKEAATMLFNLHAKENEGGGDGRSTQCYSKIINLGNAQEDPRTNGGGINTTLSSGSTQGDPRQGTSWGPALANHANPQGDPRAGANWGPTLANIANPQGDPRHGAGWGQALGDNDKDGIINSLDATPNGSGGGGGTGSGGNSTMTYRPPRDTRTQEQKIAQMNQSLASAKQAAAGGNPRPLQDFDRMFGVTRDTSEYKRAFYDDYTSNKLSSSTENEIRDWFAHMDANNDGKIQASEMTENAKNLVGGYAGSDGALSRDEAISYHTGKIGGMDAKLDASGLPEASKREIRSWFIGQDKNNDGKVASSEMGAPALAINTAAGYMTDGSLSLDEAIAYHKGKQDAKPVAIGKVTDTAMPPEIQPGSVKTPKTNDQLLAESGLSNSRKAEIKSWWEDRDASKDGYIQKSEMGAYAQSENAAALADGKLSMQEAIVYHQKKDGVTPTPARTGLPTAPLSSTRPEYSDTVNTVIKGAEDAGLRPRPTASSSAEYTVRSDGTAFGAPKFVAVAADGKELRFIEQTGKNTGKYYLHNGRPVASIDEAVKEYHASIGLGGGSGSTPATNKPADNPMATSPSSSATQKPNTPSVINGPAKVGSANSPAPKTNDQLLASSGLGQSRKEEIKSWWSARDENKDNFIQKSEMGSYAQSENATALADGKLSMQEAIKYHQDRDLAAKPIPAPATPTPTPVAIGKVIDTASPPKPQPTAVAKPVNTPMPMSNGFQVANSGLSAARKEEINTWWKDRDANKDGYIQKSEMGAYAQKENATALADGKLSMQEAISYHQKKDGVTPKASLAATSFGGRGSTIASSMPASAVKPTNNATGFSPTYK